MYKYGGYAMLTKFEVENYKSFNKNITLDLAKSRDYDFNKNAIFENGVIKNAVIFGNNGCGKSNFSYALFDIVATLTDRNVDPLLSDIGSFLNFNSKKQHASFHYEFLFNNQKIIYEYKKANPSTIVYEALTVGQNKVFECDTKKQIFTVYSLEKIGFNTFTYSDYKFDIAFLRYLRTNTSHSLDSVVSFIIEFANKMLWFRSLHTNSYIGIKNGSENVTAWIIENNYVKDFEKFLYKVGGLKVNLGVSNTNNPFPQKVLIELNNEGTKGLNYDNICSSGTRAMLILFYWFKQIKNVSFLFVDEFDAFYHFSLSKKVIELFKEINTMQALFSSHNTYISNNDILRPDCYFTISNGEIKSFSERTARELREGHNLEKLLRSGEFNE